VDILCLVLIQLFQWHWDAFLSRPKKWCIKIFTHNTQRFLLKEKFYNKKYFDSLAFTHSSHDAFSSSNLRNKSQMLWPMISWVRLLMSSTLAFQLVTSQSNASILVCNPSLSTTNSSINALVLFCSPLEHRPDACIC
jgi:hypothetical protein